MKILGDGQSGNCYKLQLLCHLLNIEHQWQHIDILQGETRTESFLATAPNGKIPVLLTDDGKTLWESNAILNFLAEGSEYLPADSWLRAQILQWQFFEQYSHEPYIATARYIAKYLGLPAEREAEYRGKQTGGHKALAVMESHLEKNTYLVGEQYTIADISLFAYTHVAHEGGFDLTPYPALKRWLARIASHPKHLAMSA